MKKAIIVLFSVLISVLFLETGSAQGIKFGVRAGYNSSNWRGETKSAISDMSNSSPYFSIKEKSGFYAGIYSRIPITEKIIFEPGLSYSQKGVTVTGALPGENIFKVRATITNHSHYIDLPLQFKAYLTDQLYVFGGPQVSYLVANEIEGRAGLLGISVGRKIDFDYTFQKWDVGITSGVGVEFNRKVNFQVGYDHGLTRLDNTINANIYNRVIKAGLGINF